MKQYKKTSINVFTEKTEATPFYSKWNEFAIDRETLTNILNILLDTQLHLKNTENKKCTVISGEEIYYKISQIVPFLHELLYNEN